LTNAAAPRFDPRSRRGYAARNLYSRQEADLHEVAVPHALPRAPRIRAFSTNDLYEIVAISVLAPASWLVPHRLWDLVSVALSLGRRLRRCLAAHPPTESLFALRVRIMAGYMEERLQILREYRPGGWRGQIEMTGREHLDRALMAGRGVVLWVCPFTYGDLIVKTALARAGLQVSHLSACSRGFSPNACHPWTPTRFGKRHLSPLRTRVEDRYLHERVIMPRDGSLGYVRRVERLLQGGGILTIRAGAVGHRTTEVPIFGGLMSLATGPPSLAAATGAALLPAFVVRRGPGRFEVVFEPRLEPAPDADPRAAIETLTRRYAELLESYVVRFPHMWSGWYSLRFSDPDP
jgi:lauroyl/myristoyl acyltransferase